MPVLLKLTRYIQYYFQCVLYVPVLVISVNSCFAGSEMSNGSDIKLPVGVICSIIESIRMNSNPKAFKELSPTDFHCLARQTKSTYRGQATRALAEWLKEKKMPPGCAEYLSGPTFAELRKDLKIEFIVIRSLLDERNDPNSNSLASTSAVPTPAVPGANSPDVFLHDVVQNHPWTFMLNGHRTRSEDLPMEVDQTDVDSSITVNGLLDDDDPKVIKYSEYL